jgi:hypothetical protein
MPKVPALEDGVASEDGGEKKGKKVKKPKAKAKVAAKSAVAKKAKAKAKVKGNGKVHEVGKAKKGKGKDANGADDIILNLMQYQNQQVHALWLFRVGAHIYIYIYRIM